jgi:hypothetical protein
MRSRSTNILQVFIIIAGLSYMVLGMMFFISPFALGKILAIDPNTEWLSQMHDEFVMLIYLFGRGLSPLLFITGLAMVMPLYDPLKYRLMVYLFCAIFPFITGIFFLVTGLSDNIRMPMVLGSVFLGISILNLTALLLTKENARKGIE